jgi:hypothetical protein
LVFEAPKTYFLSIWEKNTFFKNIAQQTEGGTYPPPLLEAKEVFVHPAGRNPAA